MIDLFKKFFTFIGILFLVTISGIALWSVCADNADISDVFEKTPETPTGNYSGYYYSRLEDDEKIVYELIADDIKQLPKKIRIPEIDDEGLSDVFDALHYDNPDYLFLGESCTIQTSFGISYFIPQYIMDENEYASAMRELSEIKDNVLRRTASFTNDYDKELYVHDYIIDKCNYVEKVGGIYSSSYGCLVRGSASCEGYAKAMKYLLDAMDIENYLVYGTTKTNDNTDEGHAWNIIKVNSGYYHVDTTWDDPCDSEAENKYAYFNITDKEIAETHTVDSRFEDTCTEDNENYYVKNNIIFDTYDNSAKNNLTSELAKQITLGNETFSFKLKNRKALEEAKRELFDMNGIYSILYSAGTAAGKNITQEEVLYAVDDTHMIIIVTDYL